MSTIHLLHGFVGAGKTTFAKKLEQEIDAVRFTPDEWMYKLYGSDPPLKHFQDYHVHILDLIWHITARLVHLHIDVILDFGFWTRQSRDEAKERAKALGAAVKLYAVLCPESIMRSRVLARTRAIMEGTLQIDEYAIDEFNLRYEPAGEDEECIIIDGTNTQPI